MKGRDENKPGEGEREDDASAIGWLASHSRALASPAPARKQSLRKRMLAGLPPRPVRRARTRGRASLRLAGIAAVALTLSTAGIVEASAAALPGEGLFTIKLLVEDLRMAAALTPEARSEVMAQRIDARLLEIVQLQSMGKSEGVAEGLALLEGLLVQSEEFQATPELEDSLIHSHELLGNGVAAPSGEGGQGLDAVLEALDSASEKAGLPAFAEEYDAPTGAPSATATPRGEEPAEDAGTETSTPTSTVEPTPRATATVTESSGGPLAATNGPGNGNSNDAPGRQDEHPGRGNSDDDEDGSTNGTPPGHANKKKNEDKIRGGKN